MKRKDAEDRLTLFSMKYKNINVTIFDRNIETLIDNRKISGPI